jgi:hypothetical protein
LFITTEGGAPLLTETSGLQILVAGPTPPLQNIIPSYLYQEYYDDSDLQAFAASYNAIAQGYLNFFNQTPLSVYTNPNVSGALLDWVGEGIYGISRPVFSSLTRKFRAGLGALPLGTKALAEGNLFQSGSATSATDDYYRRVLTWWLYVGNGRQFNIEVLRLKVARFIYGTNGTDVTLSQAQAIHITADLVSPLAAPTLSATAGGSIPARTYGACTTYVNAIGETLAGPPASLTVAANNVIVVNSPPPLAGATGWYPYVGVLSTNPTKFKGALGTLPLGYAPLAGSNKRVVEPLTRQIGTSIPIAIGTNWTEPTSGLIVGAALPTTNTSNTVGNFIITVPAAAGAASSYFQQAFNQGLLSFPFTFTATVVIA